MQNYFKMYNGDKCIFDAEVSCVSDPIQASLKEILLYEIRLLSYYTLKLKEFNFEYKKYAKHIIDGVCVVSLNMEINRNEFSEYLLNLIDLRCEAQKNYIDYCEKNNLDLQILKAYTDKCSDFNFIDALKQGELQNIQKNKILDKDKKSLYDILYIILQNACRNIAQINLFNENEAEDETIEIIKLISSTNFKSTGTEKLKSRIEKASQINYGLYKKLKNLSYQRFGIPHLSEVKLDYKKGKAVLVTGDSLMDLYDFLQATKDTDINVYTHDALILAHCYDEFKKFKNLVGHYQKSIENLEMDFSSFPGVILITRNGNGNYLNIIRGLIYTTNEIGGKGVTVVKNNDFENLIKTANEQEGFKKDKQFDKIQIGRPLLTFEDDYKACCDIVMKYAPAPKEETALVFMGHGTSHTAKVSYSQMQTQMKELGYDNVFIGTVEGEPEETACEAVIDAVAEAGYTKVILRPLMVVAGDHANNDMAGGDEDSWLSMFKASGKFDSVDTQIAGLGEIEGIQQIYVEHTADAMNQ